MAFDFLSLNETRATPETDGALVTLRDWVETYPMNTHPQLGRSGIVCPFTRLARKHDTMRLGICESGPDDATGVFMAVRRGFQALERIPATAETEALRTVVIGFPNCNNGAGIAAVHQAQRGHKLYAVMRFRMMGFMHPTSDSGGLWNPEFRPLRAPMPVLAIRYLVEQDAALIANHRLQWPSYFLKFGPAGIRKVLALRRTRAGAAHRPSAAARSDVPGSEAS
jgi:hypothetical protein